MAVFTHGGNLNVLSWEGDGTQRRFVIEGSAPPEIGSVLEDAGRWPVGRFGVDTGFRWSYDGTALIVADDQDPPAEGVIISCSYEPEEHVGDGEWTELVFKALDPSDDEREFLAARRVDAAFGFPLPPK
jgi:hypothetical protein